MAVSNHGITPHTPPAPSSPDRISLSTTPAYSPKFIPSPRSPTSSVHPVTNSADGTHALDIPDSSSPSVITSRAASPLSNYSASSTAGIKSGRRATFSEEKEVVLGSGGTSSISLTEEADSRRGDSTDENDAFMRAVKTRIGSVGGPDAFAPSPTRTVKSPSVAAVELAQARKVSMLFAGNGEGQGLGIFDEPKQKPERKVSADSNVAPKDNEEGSGEATKHDSVMIAAGRQARMNRPRMVEHRPMKSKGGKASEVLGQDWVTATSKQGGIVLPRPDEILGPTDNLKEFVARKGSINYFPSGGAIEMVNLPYQPTQEPQLDAASEAADIGLGTIALEGPLPSRQFSLMDALRSNPPDPSGIPKRAATIATTPTRQRRKPTFSIPPSVDTQAAKRFSRESVLNTPYPSTESGKEKKFEKLGTWREGEGYKGLRKEMIMTESAGTKAVVAVILYSRGQTAPAVGKVVIPPQKSTQHRPPSWSGSPKRHKAGTWKTILIQTIQDARSLSPFDDEVFILALRAEYLSLRGPIRTFFSARSLQGTRLLSYSYLSSLSDREMTHQFFQSRAYQGYGLGAEESGEIRMEELLLSPGRGKGKTKLVEWIRGLLDAEEGEKIAVCFVEGWSFVRLFTAFGCVVLASVVATVVWVLLGVNAQGSTGQTAGDGWRNAGGRVEVGLLLGLLVLLQGWTGMASWALLSWLVM